MIKGTGASYNDRRHRDGDWRLWIACEYWNSDLWRLVRERVTEQAPSKHPQTLRVELRPWTGENVGFLKVFHSHSKWDTVKDLFRSSKAVRALRQGLALRELGFNAPLAIAAGEHRRHGILERSFLLTIQVKGQPLPDYLYDRWRSSSAGVSFVEKRKALEKLAAELGRLHTLGFVHGDLVPANIFVDQMAAKEIAFYFMDNDRTRHYPRWFPQTLWRRNLVQLNRFPLPAISLHDRMRFLRHYLGRERYEAQDRRLILWLEKKTRKRRWECDQVKGARSFRELMRWNGPFAAFASEGAKLQSSRFKVQS
jgi:hypothetical protein